MYQKHISEPLRGVFITFKVVKVQILYPSVGIGLIYGKLTK